MQEYIRILEDLRVKREVIDETIDAISKLLESNGIQTTSVEPRKPDGTYTGMTVLDAARKYLAMVGRPAPTKELVEALEKGGLKHGAKDFYASVYAILRQATQRPNTDIRRNALDWELVSHT